MNMIPHKQLIEQLNWRYAVKQFDPARKISPHDWAILKEALWLTPSSWGLQPWKFVTVTEPALREKLVPASWGQTQVAEASHVMVFAIFKDVGENFIDAHLQRIAAVRQMPVEALAPIRGMMTENLMQDMDANAREQWAVNQVFIALGNFLTSAAILGIDACPMAGIDQAAYDQILGLEQLGLKAVVVASAGYRSAEDKHGGLKKVRFPRDEVFVEIHEPAAAAVC